MNLRVLRALLWKDYRVHRPVLILGVVLLVLPYVGGALMILLAERGSRDTWITAETVAGMSFASLVFSLVTMLGLAGHAFAAEREDRASEFLSCLPAPRWMTLGSKVVLMTATVLSLVLFNLVPLIAVRPHLSGPADNEVLWMLAPTGSLLFGAAWLASAGLRRSALASACGLAAPIIVVAGLQGFQITWAPASFELGAAYQGICLGLGIAGLVAGCVVYLVRFEP